MEYWNWLFNRLKRKLWWQAILFGLLGVFTALVAMAAEYIVPWKLPFQVQHSAVESLLQIISSSMLTVTTFSLGAMTAAFSAVTSNVTPRATKLLMEDRVTHNVLSTFIGTFVFSIVGIIVLKCGSYGEHGRAVLFVITICVLALIVIQLLRWVNHLVSLGRVSTTLDRLEKTASDSIRQRLTVPYLGANPWFDKSTPPEGAIAVYAEEIGYVQFVDVAEISDLCEKFELHAWIPVNAGTFVYKNTVVCWITGTAEEKVMQRIADQFVIADTRTFDQDPRFGLAVLAEVGQRALSPATNDPGTAIEVVGRLTRLMEEWSHGREDVEVRYPKLHISPLNDDDLFEDSFLLLARDGAHLIEVQLRLLKSLAALQQSGSASFKEAARQQAQMAIERALENLKADCDLQRLRAEAQNGAYQL